STPRLRPCSIWRCRQTCCRTPITLFAKSGDPYGFPRTLSIKSGDPYGFPRTPSIARGQSFVSPPPPPPRRAPRSPAPPPPTAPLIDWGTRSASPKPPRSRVWLSPVPAERVREAQLGEHAVVIGGPERRAVRTVGRRVENDAALEDVRRGQAIRHHKDVIH